MRHNLDHLTLAELTEYRSLHDDTSFHEDSALSRDRTGSENIVASAHLDGNPCEVTFGDRLMDALAKRTLNTSDAGDADEHQFLCEVLIWNVTRFVCGNASRRARLEVTIADSDGAEGLVGINR